MIDFFEMHNPDGTMLSCLRADGLPRGMSYTIKIREDGWCESKSRAHGNGSIRYYSHRTYAEAQAHALTWAKRKIREATREAA